MSSSCALASSVEVPSFNPSCPRVPKALLLEEHMPCDWNWKPLTVGLTKRFTTPRPHQFSWGVDEKTPGVLAGWVIRRSLVGTLQVVPCWNHLTSSVKQSTRKFKRSKWLQKTFFFHSMDPYNIHIGHDKQIFVFTARKRSLKITERLSKIRNIQKQKISPNK